MFIKTEGGRLVNLQVVGELSIRRDSGSGKFKILAFTGGAGDVPALYVYISYHDTEEAAQEALDALFDKLVHVGLALL